MDETATIEEWHGADPSANSLFTFCCVSKIQDIQRLKIDSVDTYDQNKWDLMKQCHKDDEEMSDITSQGRSSYYNSPKNKFNLSPNKDDHFEFRLPTSTPIDLLNIDLREQSNCEHQIT